eukprot:TRINITY_DN4372_c6_g1_i1.p1 TRINITY_DN4372_c6_g1~~TRINITY_DN4372_c6_g1_i1.p1  ORF type:complete len:2743 (+),score=487.11 TRINITY_DN4372_c6_g1_i1:100-8328(+)
MAMLSGGGGAPELRFGDRLCFQNVLTEGHLSTSFIKGMCFPVVTIHEEHPTEEGIPTQIPSSFERCIFTLKRPIDDDYTATEEGTVVTYGRWVKIVNITSQKQLTVTMKSNTQGRYQSGSHLTDLTIDIEEPACGLSAISEAGTISRLEDTFRILPRGKIREEGESVRAGEQVVLESVVATGLVSVGGVFPNCTIFTSQRTPDKHTMRALETVPQVATTPESAIWTVDLFDPPAEATPPQVPISLMAGTAVSILHKETDSYLEGQPTCQPPSTTGNSFPDVFFQKSQRIVGKEDPIINSNSIWIVESNEMIKGGPLLAGGYGREFHYRLRHLASGRYLCSVRRPDALKRGAPRLILCDNLVEEETESQISTADGSLVTFYPLDDSEECLKETTYARVELAACGSWLHCNGTDLLPPRPTPQVGDIEGNRRSVKLDGFAPLRATLTSKMVYEDIYCIQQVDWSVVYNVNRIVSMVPILKAAADTLSSSETFSTWNVIMGGEKRSRRKSVEPMKIAIPSDITPPQTTMNTMEKKDTEDLLVALRDVIAKDRDPEIRHKEDEYDDSNILSPLTAQRLNDFTFASSPDPGALSNEEHTQVSTASSSPSVENSSTEPSFETPPIQVSTIRQGRRPTPIRLTRCMYHLDRGGDPDRRLGFICTGNVIIKVAKGGVAEGAGLVPGMRIVSVDGNPVMDDSDNVMAAFRKAGCAITVRIDPVMQDPPSDTDEDDYVEESTPRRKTVLFGEPPGAKKAGVSFGSNPLGETLRPAPPPRPFWNVSTTAEPKLLLRSQVRALKTVPPCRVCINADNDIVKGVNELLATTWASNVRQLLIDTTAVLSNLLAFVVGEEVGDWAIPRRPYLHIKHRVAARMASDSFKQLLPPTRQFQKMLLEQDIHFHVIKLLRASFVLKGEKNSMSGGLHISEINEVRYQVLHRILTLGYRLVMKSVVGSPDLAVHLTNFLNFFESQSGYRLNTTDTIHAIVHNNEKILRELSDEMIIKLIELLHSFGRSPSYLNLLAALCVCNGNGQIRSQQIICERLIEGNDSPELERIPLLYKTRLEDGNLWIQLLPSHHRDPAATFNDPEILAWDNLISMGRDEGSPSASQTDLGGKWVTLGDFVARESSTTIRYFEKQLHLFACIATGNDDCSMKVSTRIPKGHILAALAKTKWTEEADAVRTGFLELARVVHLHPAAVDLDYCDPNVPDFIEKIKELLTRDLSVSTRLIVPQIQKNRLVCEMLNCAMFLTQNDFFTSNELQHLVPVLCKVLDPSDDIRSFEIGGAVGMEAKARRESLCNLDPNGWSFLVRAIEENLNEVKQTDSRFDSTEENKVVMACKLVCCLILETIYKQKQPIGEWVSTSLSVRGPFSTQLTGRRALAKILIGITLYKGNQKLFYVAFQLLCRCLSEEEDGFIETTGLFEPPSTEQDSEHPAIIAFAELLTQDVSHQKENLLSDGPSIGGNLTRHLVDHFKENPYDDPVSVSIALRVLRRVIYSAKTRDGEHGMVNMQNILNSLGCTELVTSLIQAPDSEQVVHQALLFGIALLENGNLQVQGCLMKYFETLNDESFFASLRGRMQKGLALIKEAQMREKKRAMETNIGTPLHQPSTAGSDGIPLSPSSFYKDGQVPFYLETNLYHVKDVLRLLQLFCEGHNLDLQSYIHSQPDNLHSMDLVKESFLLLKAILALRLSHMDSYLMDIVLQGFNSLTEYCQGPCKDNQTAIVHSHVANEVTIVLCTEYTDLTLGRISQEEADQVRNAATITLLSLLEGCQERDHPKTILRTLDLGLIGNTLDDCWANRKSATHEGEDSALELGFNLFIFMETMSAFDDRGYLENNRFFMKSEAGFTYFTAMTGRIEISRDANLERVYFRIPEICLNLSETTKKQVLWTVDRDTPAARISSFFSMADDVLFEMKYGDLHFSERVLRDAKNTVATSFVTQPSVYIPAMCDILKVLIHRNITKFESYTISLALFTNILVLVCHPYGPTSSLILALLAAVQIVLTSACLLHTVISLGPILAHKTMKKAADVKWSRFQAELGTQQILSLRDPVGDQEVGLEKTGRGSTFRVKREANPEWGIFRQSPQLPTSSPHLSPSPGGSGLLDGFATDKNYVSNDPEGGDGYESDPTRQLATVRRSTNRVRGASTMRSPSGVAGKTLGHQKWLAGGFEPGPPSPSVSRWVKKQSIDAQQALQDIALEESFNAVSEDDELTAGFGSFRTKKQKRLSNRQPQIRRRRRSSSHGQVELKKDVKDDIMTPLLSVTRMQTGSPRAVGSIKSDPQHLNISKSNPASSMKSTGSARTISPHQSPLPARSASSSSAIAAASPGGRRKEGSHPPANPAAAPSPSYEIDNQTTSGSSVGQYWFIFLCLISEPSFLALTAMVGTSILGVIASPLFLTVHLFSIVSGSTVLQSVIRSITKNGKSLLLTGLLAVFIVYMFSVIGFLFFRDSFDNAEQTCGTLLRCFAHSLFHGIRAGGGIGDLMEAPTTTLNVLLDTDYGVRATYDFLFFVIVIVILLNIIFGIIIDTFAELRSEKQKIDDDIKTKCFICGIESSEFERHADGFDYHIKRDHNMWLYIYFIHHLRTKESSEFTGQESHVFDRMTEHDLSFFPTNRAICLQNKASQGQGHDNASDRVLFQPSQKITARQLESIETKLADVKNESKTQNKKVELLERRSREMTQLLQTVLTEMQRVSLGNNQDVDSPVQTNHSPASQRARRGTAHDVTDPGAVRRSRSTSVFTSAKSFIGRPHV